MALAVTLSESPQFPVRVASTLPPMPALARSVHWLRPNVTPTLTGAELLPALPTVTSQLDAVPLQPPPDQLET